MISLTLSKSLLVVVALVCLLCQQSCSASPLVNRSGAQADTQQLESKSRIGSNGPQLVEVVDDGPESSLPMTMESLDGRLVGKSPSVRMLRSAIPQLYEEDEADELPRTIVRNGANSAEQQQQLSHMLAQYFRLTNGGVGSNRFPRRVSATSKRAGNLILNFFISI